MYHAACKVELQPFKRSYSQLTFFNFLLNTPWPIRARKLAALGRFTISMQPLLAAAAAVTWLYPGLWTENEGWTKMSVGFGRFLKTRPKKNETETKPGTEHFSAGFSVGFSVNQLKSRHLKGFSVHVLVSHVRTGSYGVKHRPNLIPVWTKLGARGHASSYIKKMFFFH